MEDIQLTDWQRIFFGSAPPSFYLELLIRAFIIYMLLMLSMRALGKRMSAQMSRLEMTAMVAFASAVGVPMLSPSNGLLPAIVIAIIIITLTKIIARISFKSEKFEQVTQGDIDCLVTDSVMDPGVMERVRITRERLFAQLRSENFDHLGKVKRVYLEANGTFTLIAEENPKPGLLVLPQFDEDFINEKLRTTDKEICNNCGESKPQKGFHDGNVNCSNCGATEWAKAVIEA